VTDGLRMVVTRPSNRETYWWNVRRRSRTTPNIFMSSTTGRSTQ